MIGSGVTPLVDTSIKYTDNIHAKLQIRLISLILFANTDTKGNLQLYIVLIGLKYTVYVFPCFSITGHFYRFNGMSNHSHCLYFCLRVVLKPFAVNVTPDDHVHTRSLIWELHCQWDYYLLFYNKSDSVALRSYYEDAKADMKLRCSHMA